MDRRQEVGRLSPGIHPSGSGSCGDRRRTGVEGWWAGEPGIVGCSGRPVSGRFMVRGGCTSTWEGEGSELCRAGLTAALTGAGGVQGKPGDRGFESRGREGCCVGGLVCLCRGNERIGMASGGETCRQDGSPWRAGDAVSCTFMGWSRKRGEVAGGLCIVNVRRWDQGPASLWSMENHPLQWRERTGHGRRGRQAVGAMAGT